MRKKPFGEKLAVGKTQYSITKKPNVRVWLMSKFKHRIVAENQSSLRYLWEIVTGRLSLNQFYKLNFPIFDDLHKVNA